MRCFVVTLVLSIGFLAGGVHAQTVREWVHKAQEQYDAGNYSQSAESYASAIEAGAALPATYYHAACSCALAGRKDEAFDWLGESITRGFHDIEQLQTDSDLSSLHEDVRWKDMLRRCEQRSADHDRTVTKPELRTELLEMMRVDQKWRMALQDAPAKPKRTNIDSVESNDIRDGEGKAPPGKPVASNLIAKLMEVDLRNTARMKEIVDKHGWPTIRMVGDDGAQAAWLLVQHADMDLSFQKRCLVLMLALPGDQVSKTNIAYLTDRVLVGEGKLQRYGTQFLMKDGKLQPSPIEDKANLDKRRKSVGLGPMSEYTKLMSGKN